MAKYIFTVSEIFHTKYEVEADSILDAFDNFSNSTVVDDELEYDGIDSDTGKDGILKIQGKNEEVDYIELVKLLEMRAENK